MVNDEFEDEDLELELDFEVDELADFEDLEDSDDEFDIQKTVLKQRNNTELTFYVEYDKLSNSVLAISPTEISASNPRHAVFKSENSKLIEKLFKNKIALSRLTVRRNEQTGIRELIENVSKHRDQFDFVFAKTDLHSFIHMHVDVVTKRVQVSLNYDILKEYLAREIVTESDLRSIPDSITIYCVDLNEKSRLLDQLTIDTKVLFELETVSFTCHWLPSNIEKVQEIGFLYYNNQLITVDTAIRSPEKISHVLKPTILYKHVENVLHLQSTIQDIESYRLGGTLNLFLYKKSDPSKILESVSLNSTLLNNYNYFEVITSVSEEIGIISNYAHLHIEDLNVSTYYQL